MYITSSRLRAEIVEPDIYPNIRTRFDKAGFVRSVILDNAHEFCTEENHFNTRGWNGGAGLCNEFQFDQVSIDCPIGEWFPKFGVGLLKKETDQVFKGFIDYEFRPFPISFHQVSPSRIDFHIEPVLCMGYAVEETKSVYVEDNQLVMENVLHNVGEKDIEMRELCHNFLTLEHFPLGPGYHVTLPVKSLKGKAPDGGYAMKGTDDGYSFHCYSQNASVYKLGSEWIRPVSPYSWTLSHDDLPVKVSETTDLTPTGLIIWNIDHIVATELLLPISIKAGESVQWKRTWTFED